ncbi:MAG: hypothetical protein HWE34_18770 [Methylocystaceae bacterium]|nr:hypothetical protein [Methylocystaceae bacterium]
MDEILELRNRITDVEATLASNVDALTAAMGGAVMGAIITGVAGYILYRLQQTTAKKLYELQKLEQLSKDLEDLRVMFSKFDGDIVGQSKGVGNNVLKNPNYQHFCVVLSNLGFDKKYGLELQKLVQKCISVVEAGAQCFIKIGTSEAQTNYDDFRILLEQLNSMIDNMQGMVSGTMLQIVNKL